MTKELPTLPKKPKKVFVKNPRLDDFDRIARLNRLMSACVDKRMNLVAEALLLGYPSFTNDPTFETAGVGITKDGRIQYTWNRAFFDSITDVALQYVAFHEALHVILCHPQRRMDREPRLWNIAVDVVVNEALDDLLPKSEVMELSVINNDPVMTDRIKTNICGMYFDNQSAEEVYHALLKEKKKQQTKAQKKRQKQIENGKTPDDAGDPQSGQGDGDGDGQETLDSHKDWDNIINGEMQEELNGIIEELKEAEEEIEKGSQTAARRNTSGQMAGLGSPHLKIELAALTKPYKIPWQKLLRGRLASVRKPYDGENWGRPNRKLYSVYPDILLPGAHEAEILTSSIFLSIDTSGSMNDDMIGELAAIVKSLPEDAYEQHITWFDTSVYECTDLTKPMGRGGTEFECIERAVKGESTIYVEDDAKRYNKSGVAAGIEMTRYPDVVICLTDGHNYGRPNISMPERWIFMITKDGTDQYVSHLPGVTIWKLEE